MTKPFYDRQAWLIALAAWSVFGTLMLLPPLLLSIPIDFSVYINMPTSVLIVVPLSMVVFSIASAAQNQTQTRRVLLLIASVFAAGLLSSMLDAYKGRLLMDIFEPGVPDMPVLHRGLRQSAGFITEFAIILSLHLVLLYVRETTAKAAELAAAREEANRAAIAAAEAESAATAARLEALRYQLNPHFLFNTLNAISSSVLTGRPEAAEATLTKLCSFLRATLAANNSGMVAIEEELQTIADYLAIEKARLGDRLTINFECPPELREAAVPSFLLQPLVENAIKHGVGATSRQVILQVEVSTTDAGELEICVTDNACATRVAPIKGTGLGLANIRERLSAVFGSHAYLDAAPTMQGFRARIVLPLTTVSEPAYARAAG